MKIAAYYRSNPSRTNERVKAVAESLGAVESTREAPLSDCDLAVQAGFQISPAMKDAMERRIPILILENPVWHYGDKFDTYTVGYNGLNGLSYLPSCEHLPTRSGPELAPWRDPFDGQITVFGQVEHDKALRGADIRQWVDWVQTIVPGAVYREHPIMLTRAQQAEQEPFEECLERTSLAITYTSTVGAEAVLRGVPTVAVHRGSLAYEVASHGLTEAPRRPDREVWRHNLTWRHWRTSEALDKDWLLSGYEEALEQAKKGQYDNMSNGRHQ